MRLQTIVNLTAAAILVAVVAKTCYDWNTAKRALYDVQLSASRTRADSLADLLAASTLSIDSLRQKVRSDSIELAKIDLKINIKEPGVIEVDTSYRHPDSMDAPAMEIFVPPEVTDLILAQRAQIVDLRAALAESNKRWMFEHGLRLEREREIEILKKINQPRFGVKTGVLLGVLGTVAVVQLVQQ